eukprot:1793613-Pleurochrysis_carterae.AAC.5
MRGAETRTSRCADAAPAATGGARDPLYDNLSNEEISAQAALSSRPRPTPKTTQLSQEIRRYQSIIANNESRGASIY